MLKEIYVVIVSGATFDRAKITFDKEPTEQEIANAIISEKGSAARIEKRFVLA